MIQRCISSRAFAPGTSISTMAESSAQAGFDGVELVVNDRGELNLATPPADVAAVLRHFRKAGLAVAALTSDLYTTHNFASPDESSRRTALETTRRLIELACRLEAPLVWLRGAVIDPSNQSDETRTEEASGYRLQATGRRVSPRSPEPGARSPTFVSYETALNHVFQGMMEVAEQAEKRGVKIAVRAAGDGFLLSPVETRNFVDRLNSPAIGVAFNLSDVARFGCPVDWLRCLGYRLLGVFLGAGEESSGEGRVIDTAKICEALNEVRYEGPVIYESAGDLSEIAAILKAFSA